MHGCVISLVTMLIIVRVCVQHVRWGSTDIPVGIVLVWLSGGVGGGTAPPGPGVADWLSCGWGGARGTGPR